MKKLKVNQQKAKSKVKYFFSNYVKLLYVFCFLDPSTSRNARQLRTRETTDDDQIETQTSTDNNDMYTRAKEKHARAIEREQRGEDIKEEPINDEIPKITKTAVKVRRINDETTQNFDDEQIEMGVGLSGKKHQKETKKTETLNTKENDLEITMPIENEKRRQAQETRIERIRRLCEKRTIGDVLDMAKQAYFERQQKRELFKDYIEREES